MGFLGYTGAADFSETLPHLQAACSYFEETQPQVIFLLGHWNNEGLGCSEHMAVPEIHAALLQIPGCASFGRWELQVRAFYWQDCLGLTCGFLPLAPLTLVACAGV